MKNPLKSRLFYRQTRFLLSNVVLYDRIINRVEDVIKDGRIYVVFVWLCYEKLFKNVNGELSKELWKVEYFTYETGGYAVLSV